MSMSLSDKIPTGLPPLNDLIAYVFTRNSDGARIIYAKYFYVGAWQFTWCTPEDGEHVHYRDWQRKGVDVCFFGVLENCLKRGYRFDGVLAREDGVCVVRAYLLDAPKLGLQRISAFRTEAKAVNGLARIIYESKYN